MQKDNIRHFVFVLFVGVISHSQAWASEGAGILEKRCADCHKITGPSPTTLKEAWERKGPDLFYAGNKYKEKWLKAWLKKPTRIRPAGMFYGNHIKPGVDHDVVDEASLTVHPVLGVDDAEEVAEVLMTLKGKSELIKPGDYVEGSISVSMGEMMFDKFRGCLACHQIEPGYGGFSGPEIYTAANRLQEDYMVSFMRNPRAWDPMTFMPTRKSKETDLQKFVHYFRALSKEEFE